MGQELRLSLEAQTWSSVWKRPVGGLWAQAEYLRGSEKLEALGQEPRGSSRMF